MRRRRQASSPGDADARPGAPTEPVRVVRIISRLNIGGPAIQAITLTKLLEPRGYRTSLVRGREDPDEGSMDDLATRMGVTPVLVPWMSRDIGWRDAFALPAIVRILRQMRPALVHTHAAKAGTLGRLAVILAFPRRRSRPVVVHTFHGHSLHGYFSSRRDRLHRAIEAALARRTDRLVAVSPEVRDELVAMGVAPADKFEVVRVGFDLSPFDIDGDERARRRDDVRRELGIGSEETVVTLVARLVPIKRVDRFLRVASSMRDSGEVRFVVVGDGELRDQLRGSPEARSLGGQLVWTGFRSDMPDVYFASDVVVQTSDNEGTPVALVEAQAAGVPVVTTAVGGTASVVLQGESGAVAPVDDEESLALAINALLDDPDRRTACGDVGRHHVLRRFHRERLLDDIDRLYKSLLGA